MVGSFSRAFGGCRSNFSRFRSSHAKSAFNGARSGSQRKVFYFPSIAKIDDDMSAACVLDRHVHF